jgi:hypothetical protein
MRGPPDPSMERAASAKGSPRFQSSSQPHQLNEAASDYQAQTELAQIFARKFIVARKRRRSAER